MRAARIARRTDRILRIGKVREGARAALLQRRVRLHKRIARLSKKVKGCTSQRCVRRTNRRIRRARAALKSKEFASVLHLVCSHGLSGTHNKLVKLIFDAKKAARRNRRRQH